MDELDVELDNPEGFDPDDLEKPTLIWDGDCGFCKRSVIRLADELGDRIRYVTYQKVHDRFDDVDEEDFAQAVHFVEPGGLMYSGAEAVFRALAHKEGGSRLLWCYENAPGFGGASEWVYRRIANNRPTASKLSRWFIGEDL